ncbi:nucleoside hydrolase [Marinomonas balearica]|uniref:Inosine-uridine nucleoside N-ribohydrolase n=1 Tax=Marinomonas balearica TaxID=491947 RepID=A0A4R6MFC8_9GAMM|nr:nucleoside hydrolase [Marinomonas balearica]TDO98799.1 inosine-uridine nucleoside N-ribohydrolase [Marinomonas balearica]
MTRKIIIDTDPGIDDAMAIFFAFQAQELDVLGLTTVFGNVPVTLATENALRLAEIAGVDVPVAEGVAVPSVIAPRPHPDFVHGTDGFGNINWPSPKGKAIEQSAAEFIVEQVRQFPGEVTIVALAPLGNLAKALELDPEIANLVDEVVLMGGAAHEFGNVSPVAEANIINDPHAADKVFTAPWQVTMIGLDVTHQVVLGNAILGRIKEEKPDQGGFLYDCAQHYIKFYSDRFPIEGCYFHDASTIAYLMDPSIFTVERGPIRVACEGIALGQTIFAPEGLSYPEPHWDGVPSTQVCMEVDEERLLKLYEETMVS